MKLKINNVSKSFKNIPVLSDVTISLETGKIYGLYGRNGSGKSVLLKCICGFYNIDGGSITLDGVNYNEKKEFLPNTRVLIERPNFFPGLTGYENLKMLAKIQNKITDKDIQDALNIVNLSDNMNKKYSKYSLGMKQKLGIAQAIMENPEIIILDEPFNGIENSTVTKLIDYLKSIKKDKIIILSTHIKEDLDSLCDEVFYLDDGKIKK